MTRSTPSARPNSGLLRSRRAICLLMAVAAGTSCADDGTQPDDLRFGQIGRVLIEVSAPLGTGVGELQQTLSWRSDGPWESAERISYRGSLGDETVARSSDDPGRLARSYARWLERDHPSASASLREGLSEMFTINRLGLPPRLRKCLGSTNLIDSTHSGVRQKTRRVTNWKNGAMALRWAAASFVETEKSYRRIIGYDQLWMLRAHLDDHEPVAEMRKAG